ncbi:alpha/beta fold hydrolase [Pedobacter sp. KR3-3]|uniref:Alpha/beta fold hydrolase n=1 Tax=Pedobacter albus TaxID=3113905 RepID=A0ABU7ICX7_9SPHI|nr:alpha/beta fold hydrolase [Pedobacter sp. KR3-3]MEE1947327.1 alpha/beta fold hydrolase [Pedobacter sp. KR3-3]
MLGKVEKIKSTLLKEERTLNIYLPEGYREKSTEKYPVIYLLDGSANEDFIHTVGVVQFLGMIEFIPKAIVVGIANVDRKRDFTFPTTVSEDKKDFPTTGSSAKFIDFLAKELQPFIEKKYHVGNKTIVGQSLGGLLATEIFLKKPDLFDNYLIVSPSLWWDNESLLNQASGLLAKQVNRKQVYLAVGNEHKQMVAEAEKFGKLLQESKVIQSKFEYFEKEDHLTILHHAVYNGLQVLFPKKTK